jgi:hypothetical protein
MINQINNKNGKSNFFLNSEFLMELHAIVPAGSATYVAKTPENAQRKLNARLTHFWVDLSEKNSYVVFDISKAP